MAVTRLSIINSMLRANGVDAVTSDDSTHPDVESCIPTLDDADIEMQSRGWWFNTDWQLSILPSVTGEIILPANVLKADPCDRTLPYVRRGLKLYDPLNHTFAIGTTVSVDLVTRLEISDLPDTAGVYLRALAVHKFYVADDGDTQKAAEYLRDRNTAFAELRREHLAALDLNIRRSPSVQRVMQGFRPASRVGYNPLWPGGRNPYEG